MTLFLLPLWEKVARTKSAPDEGLRLTDRAGPLTRLRFAKPPSPTRERVLRVRGSNYGVIEIGEKSTNQLLGCTKPLIFGLIARGATSWAT